MERPTQQDRAFDGSIDDVVLYDRVLTPEDVERIMSGDILPASGTASSESPGHEAADVLRDVTLSWSPGQFACSIGVARKYLSRQQVDWSRISLVQGWFQDTLTKQLADTYSIRHASVIMVDVGLFSSASLALAFCAPLIGSTCIVIFDNWNPLDQFRVGEQSAFDRFLSENPSLVAEKLGGYCDKSEVFLVRRLS